MSASGRTSTPRALVSRPDVESLHATGGRVRDRGGAVAGDAAPRRRSDRMWRSVYDARACRSRNRIRDRGCSGRATPFASPRLRGVMLLAPAVVVAVLFSIIPLAYLFQVSLTQDSSFFFTAEYTLDNYREVFTRYRPAIVETVYLAARLVDPGPRLWIPVRLHPDPQGSLSGVRANDDDVSRCSARSIWRLGSSTSCLPNGPLGPLLRNRSASMSPSTSSRRQRCSSRWRSSRFPSW